MRRTIVQLPYKRSLASSSSYISSKPILLCTRNITTTSINHNSSSLDSNSTPWYLREENTSKVEQINQNEIIVFPESMSQSLRDFVQLLSEKYGLTDFKILDLSLLPSDHPKSIKSQSDEKYIIFTSGKSEKHIYKASYDLKQYIKHEFGHLPRIDGMVSNSVSARTRNRLAKRARQGPPATHNTYGIGPNTWVRCEVGFDGAVLHMLSPERRSELNLEQIYGEEVEGESMIEIAPVVKNNYNENKDSVFYGLQRSFHTSTRLNNNNEALESIVNNFIGSSSINEHEQFKSQFDGKFTGTSVEEYNNKFNFYKVLSLVDPNYSMEDVETILLDKHSSIALSTEKIDWNQEIVNDVIKYMELLLDTSRGLSATEKLSKLSDFISKITAFSSDELHFFAIDKFQTLLWSLSCDNYIPIDGSEINSIIQSRGEGIEISTPTSVQDARSAQNMREMFRQINFSKRGHMPLWLREHMLYTYGNCRNWVYFWKEWSAIIQSLVEPQEFLHMFTKAIIFLTIINDKIALRDFFNRYWNNNNGPSFITELAKNDNQFNSANEEQALKKALLVLNDKFGASKWYEKVGEFATK